MAMKYTALLILEVLKSSPKPLTISEIVGKFPAIGWEQFLMTADSLSRQGLLLLKRQGFDYLCELRP